MWLGIAPSLCPPPPHTPGALDDFEKARPGPPAPPPPPHVPGDPNAAKKSPGAAAQVRLHPTSRAGGWGGCRPLPTALTPPSPPQESLFASQERFFQELFDGELASQASAEFERAMKELAEEEPHLVEQFQKLSEAAGRVGLWGGRGGHSVGLGSVCGVGISLSGWEAPQRTGTPM